MKKVLIIAYYWPPGGGGGVQRWLKFVKYLPEFGWEPIVYTPENAEYPVFDEDLCKDIREGTLIIKRKIWEPFQLYRLFTRRKKDEKISTAFTSEVESNQGRENIANFIRSNFFIPDARRFWIKPSIKYLSHYLREHPVDVIVTTGPPHSMHLIGMGLQKLLGIKWVADFRDPWTNIDYFSELKLSSLARRRHHQLEKKVVKQADKLVIVGEIWKNEMMDIGASDVAVITNGFDPDDTQAKTTALDEKFSLAHIGVLMKHRNPETLWKALSELVQTSDEFRQDLNLVLIGSVDVEVMNSLKKHGLGEFTQKTGYLSHAEAVRYQKKSQVLLLPINNTPNARGMLTGKIFEYMASGRPILVIGPTDGEVARVVGETQSGLVSDFDDLETLKSHIMSYYKLYKKGRLKADTKNIEKYTRRELSRRLGEVLNEVSGNLVKIKTQSKEA